MGLAAWIKMNDDDADDADYILIFWRNKVMMTMKNNNNQITPQSAVA